MRRDSWRSVPSTYTPPSLAHLVALGLALGVVLLEQLGVARPRPRRCSGSRPSARDVALGEALGVAAEEDVDAAARHVGGDGDGVEPAGLGDDLGLAEVLLGVEHLVRHAALLEQPGELLGLLDRDGADEHRLADLVALDDVLDDGLELGVLGPVDDVGLVDRGRPAGWSGSARPGGRRCWRTRRPRWWPCRSCRRASRRGGSSSGA